jgi:hypothetical protein
MVCCIKCCNKENCEDPTHLKECFWVICVKKCKSLGQAPAVADDSPSTAIVVPVANVPEVAVGSPDAVTKVSVQKVESNGVGDGLSASASGAKAKGKIGGKVDKFPAVETDLHSTATVASNTKVSEVKKPVEFKAQNYTDKDIGHLGSVGGGLIFSASRTKVKNKIGGKADLDHNAVANDSSSTSIVSSQTEVPKVVAGTSTNSAKAEGKELSVSPSGDKAKRNDDVSKEASKIPCKYGTKCQYGDNCRFLHKTENFFSEVGKKSTEYKAEKYTTDVGHLGFTGGGLTSSSEVSGESGERASASTVAPVVPSHQRQEPLGSGDVEEVVDAPQQYTPELIQAVIEFIMANDGYIFTKDFAKYLYPYLKNLGFKITKLEVKQLIINSKGKLNSDMKREKNKDLLVLYVKQTCKEFDLTLYYSGPDFAADKGVPQWKAEFVEEDGWKKQLILLAIIDYVEKKYFPKKGITNGLIQEGVLVILKDMKNIFDLLHDTYLFDKEIEKALDQHKKGAPSNK